MPLKEFEIQIRLSVTLLAGDINKAENRLMDMIDGPVSNVLLSRARVKAVSYTMSADNPKTIKESEVELVIARCAKCGGEVTEKNVVSSEGEGPEAGRTFQYCSQRCEETH